MPTLRSASSASDPNSRSFLNVGALPTGWQPGDLVFTLLSVAGLPSGSWTERGANKWTFLSSTSDNNSGGAQHRTNICYKIMEAGDRWPAGGGTQTNNINWNGSNRCSVCAVCFQPDAGQTFTGADIGTAASPTINTTAFTTHLPGQW